MTATDVMRALIDRDERHPLVLVFDERAPAPFDGSLLGREVDDVLRQLAIDGLVDGERKPYGDGSMAGWERLQVSLAGLERVGEWPPRDQAYRSGPWVDRYWGLVVRPVLVELADSPSRFLFRPLGEPDGPALSRWRAVTRLAEAGLVDGRLLTDGLDEPRLTAAGQAVLEPPTDDPLVRARVDLGRGAKADGVTAAVEEALRDCLATLAGAHGVSLDDERGRPKSLARINNDLKGARVYGEDRRAEVGSWLALRNDVDHGRGQDISERRLERLIEGIADFREEQPRSVTA